MLTMDVWRYEAVPSGTFMLQFGGGRGGGMTKLTFAFVEFFVSIELYV
jgi:hypothetical protein